MKGEKMTTIKQLKALAKKHGVIVHITMGTGNIAGVIELEAPDGKCWEPELHFLLSVQQPDYKRGGLRPWQENIDAAMRDLTECGPRIQNCASDCECRIGG